MKTSHRLLISAIIALLTLAAQGQEQVVNTACPVMTLEEVDANSPAITFRGRTVRLCCDKCVQKFLADPERYVSRLPQFLPGAPEPSSLTDSGHAKVDDSPWRLLGKFHVLAVHFPIALLLVAAALETLSMLSRRAPCGAGVRPLLAIAAISSIAAVISGLVHADHVTLAPSLGDVLFWHRNLGIGTAVLALGAAVLGETARRSESGRLCVSFRMILLLSAVAVGLTGHYGGLMVFGQDFW